MAYLRGLSFTLPLWGHPPTGYQGPGAEAPTLSEDSDESDNEGTSWDHSSLGVVVGSETGVGTPVSTSYIPATGGPFSALIPSMWPQDILGQIQQTEDSGEHPECEYDEFGFKIEREEICKEKEDPDPHIFVTTEDPSIRLKWTAHLEFTQNHIVGDLTWDKVSTTLPRSEKLRDLVYSGIPHSMRSHLWPRLSGGLAAKATCELSYRKIVRNSMKEDSITMKQIEKDLCRTMPLNACFQSMNGIGIPKLRRILRGIAWLYPDIGYCQGMGVIISSLLLFLEEEDAFWVMVAVIEDIVPSSYYSSTLLGVQADQRVLRQLIANYLPNLDQLLKNHDIELSLITLHWFLTLLASVLPLKVLLRIWDVVFYEGSIALFRVTLGMLKLKEPILLTLENSAQIFNALSDLPGDISDADELLQYAQKASSSLTDVILETHRKKHIAFLSSDINKSSSVKHQVNQQITRRTRIPLKKSWLSMVYDIGHAMWADQFCGTSLRATDVQFVKAKNIQQTELVSELKQAIQYIARHFNQANNNKVSLEVDYSIESHAQDYENYINVARCKHRRARALIDFERHEDDELGFRKNDVITIISQKDEHCWIGELNGLRGWFPAKFVRVLDERSKDYSSVGDDSVTEAVTDLARGHLCSALRNIFDHGMRKSSLIGGPCHPWRFIEEASQREVEKDFHSVFSRLVLCKTFRLDDDGKVLAPEELLYRAVQAINASHDSSRFSMDVKFRSLVCYGLNEQVLHIWFEMLCASEDVVSRWYHPYSFLRSPAWIQIKCELRVLAQFPFSLSVDWEVRGKEDASFNMKTDVQDMLIKHHLFSWDI